MRVRSGGLSVELDGARVAFHVFRVGFHFLERTPFSVLCRAQHSFHQTPVHHVPLSFHETPHSGHSGRLDSVSDVPQQIPPTVGVFTRSIGLQFRNGTRTHMTCHRGTGACSPLWSWQTRARADRCPPPQLSGAWPCAASLPRPAFWACCAHKRRRTTAIAAARRGGRTCWCWGMPCHWPCGTLLGKRDSQGWREAGARARAQGAFLHSAPW